MKAKRSDLYQEIAKLFPVLEIILPMKLLSEVRSAEQAEINALHFSLGMFIRNNLLMPESVLYDAFVSAGIYHKDDMSSMIMKLFHDHLNA